MHQSFVEPVANRSIYFPPAVRFLLWFLGLCGLGLGIYLAPELAVTLLAVIGIGVPLLWLLWVYPVIGLLAVIALTSSFLPLELINLRLPIGGGLKLRDIALIGMSGIAGLQMLVRKRPLIPWLPVGLPLALLVGIAILSGVYALCILGVPINRAFNELRGYIFYMTFFIAGWTIVRKGQFWWALLGLIIIADLTAGIIIVQQFFGAGTPLIEAMTDVNWQVWDDAASGAVSGTIRIIPPGHMLVYFMALITSGLTIMTKETLRWRLFFIGQSLFLNLALIFTFTRSQWLASLIAMTLMFLVFIPLYKKQVIRIVIYGLPLLLFLSALVWVPTQRNLAKLPVLGQVAERALSIATPSQTLETASLKWRVFETAEAFRSIRENLFFGVGLGSSYRSITFLQDEVNGGWGGVDDDKARFTRYVHNSYLFLTVKLGLVGFGALVWLCLSFLLFGWRLFRDSADATTRGVTISILAGFIGALQWSVFHSHIMRVESTAVIGVMLGLIGAIYVIERKLVSEPNYAE